MANRALIEVTLDGKKKWVDAGIVENDYEIYVLHSLIDGCAPVELEDYVKGDR